MGCLRLFLALSVVLWHIGYFVSPLTGESAVICFYMISGFYMSMVINDSYRDGKGWQWRFYESRFLRLFPTYWIVAAFALLGTLITLGPSYVFNLAGTFNPIEWALILASNVAILGLDIINFITKAGFTHYPLLRLVGPAWTLGIELQFYAIAPFIVTRSLRACFLILALALGIHFALIGLPPDWRYYLAPSAWCFFIMGFVSHRVSALLKDDRTKRRLGYAAIGVLPLLAVIGRVWFYEDTDQILLWLFYVAFAAGTPYLFFLTKSSVLDNAVGGLSYPMYLIHFPLLQMGLHVPGLSDAAAAVSVGPNLGHKILVTIAIVVVVTLLAALLHFGVEQRIDRMRHRLRARRRRESQTAAPVATAT